MNENVADERVRKAVRQTYGDIARRFTEESAPACCCSPMEAAAEDVAPVSCCGPSEVVVENASVASCCGPREAAVEHAAHTSCCGPSQAAVKSTGTAHRLYSAEELADLPDSVTDISLGCGNPTAMAELQPGDVVLDLGSGGGIDCFLAAQRVGPEGRVIGLDMTPDMIRLARRNAKKVGATNVEFRYGEMEDIPLTDESVDVIISNCVINLSPDKDAVFSEAYRVLQPGGWMSVSDIVVHGDLPRSIRDRMDAWAGCLAGALEESDYLGKIHAAGFERVEVVSRTYVKVSEFADWEGVRALLAGAGLSLRDADHKIASIKVKAHRPA